MANFKARQLILASTSPFRRKLLEQTGLVFKVQAPLCDERTFTARTPKDLALIRALEKGRSVAQANIGSLVIGADQTLGLGGDLLEKVETEDQAFQVLKKLSGNTHELHSAIALLYQNENDFFECYKGVTTISMKMRHLTDEEISAYIKSGEWQNCVGCCRSEGLGVHLLEPTSGYSDQSAIVGLPLRELLRELRNLGVNGLTHPEGPWSLKNF